MKTTLIGEGRGGEGRGRETKKLQHVHIKMKNVTRILSKIVAPQSLGRQSSLEQPGNHIDSNQMICREYNHI